MVKEMREWNEKMKARRREGRLNAKTRADQERYKSACGVFRKNAALVFASFPERKSKRSAV